MEACIVKPVWHADVKVYVVRSSWSQENLQAPPMYAKPRLKVNFVDNPVESRPKGVLRSWILPSNSSGRL